MARVSLGDGKWFDRDQAFSISEGHWWDGRNQISRATGGQWDHQTLYYTKKGNWVICDWSQRDRVADKYYTVTEEQAAAWVVYNQLSDDKLADLPEPIRLALLKGMKGQEV